MWWTKNDDALSRCPRLWLETRSKRREAVHVEIHVAALAGCSTTSTSDASIASYSELLLLSRWYFLGKYYATCWR